jgi:hypothetical protein
MLRALPGSVLDSSFQILNEECWSDLLNIFRRYIASYFGSFLGRHSMQNVRKGGATKSIACSRRV